MNRKKKIFQKVMKKAKKAHSKKFPSQKEPYIAKADREVIDENSSAEPVESAEQISQAEKV